MSIQNVWKWLLAAAGLFYVFLLPRFHVGYYSDDAEYILAAESLTQGHNVILSLPEHPPQYKRSLGLPLLLIPFVTVWAPHWNALGLISIGAILLSGYFFWEISGLWCPPWRRLGLLTLYLFNPVTASYAVSVLTEPLFTLLALWVFFIRRPVWWLGLLLGWALLVRPEALVLLIGITVTLVVLHGRKAIGSWFFTALGIWGCQVGWIFAAGQQTGYAAAWRELVMSNSFAPLVLSNILTLTKELFVHLLWQWPWNLAGMAGKWAAAVLTVLAILAIIAGAHRTFRTRKNLQGLLTGMCVFVGLYFVAHALWPAADVRFMLPLLPFLLLLAAPYINRIEVALILISFYFVNDSAFFNGPPPGAVPLQTYDWIQHYTPVSSFFLAPKAPTLYLYTGRHAMAVAGAPTREEFRYRLLRRTISHVLTQPANVYEVLTPSGSRHVHESLAAEYWTRTWPDAFHLIYTNTPEVTSIYEVTPDYRYLKAYEFYLRGREELEQGNTKAGLVFFRQALHKDDRLASVWNALGVHALFSKDLPGARSNFAHALRVMPDFPPALLNMGRAYRQSGDMKKAADYFAKAAKAIQTTGDSESLLSVAQAEMDSML